jgi:hypothetical protein
VVVLAEADFLAWTGATSGDRYGFAALAAAESAHRGAQPGPSWGAWASVAWYFFSHFELRVDNVVRRQDATSPVSYALVAQLHLYL